MDEITARREAAIAAGRRHHFDHNTYSYHDGAGNVVVVTMVDEGEALVTFNGYTMGSIAPQQEV